MSETETIPRRRGRPAKAKAEVEADVELIEATPEDMGFYDEEFPPNAILLPAQHDTDPWGDTPAQMRGV